VPGAMVNQANVPDGQVVGFGGAMAATTWGSQGVVALWSR